MRRFPFALAVALVLAADAASRADGWISANSYAATQPTPQGPQPSNPAPVPAPDATPTFAPITSSALGDSFVAMTAPGYLDPAAPMNVFRLRYDADRYDDRPDRAEFLYAKSGVLGGRGVPRLEKRIDAQELLAYLEVAPTNAFSFFAEMPYRLVDPKLNDDTSGIGDFRFGAKVALVNECDRVVSVQLKGYAPTGDESRGLGNGHWTFEPSLLAWRKLGQRTQVYAQLGAWIPITNSDFAGNVVDYGVGVSYAAIDRGSFRICPIAELVGWTVLSGGEFTGLGTPVPLIESAAGTTIVNAKFGIRAETDRQSLYVGYGRALTDDVWYRDVVRVEYRLRY
jgi:hypothetical protein